MSIQKKKYYQNNKESILKKRAEYRKDNPHVIKEWRANNKEHRSNYTKEYRAKNWAKVLKLNSDYRARKHEAIVPWANEQMIEHIYEDAQIIKYDVDHVVPLKASFSNNQVACGLHWEDNLQILSPYINGAKNARSWPDMWDYTPYTEETLNLFNQQQ